MDNKRKPFNAQFLGYGPGLLMSIGVHYCLIVTNIKLFNSSLPEDRAALNAGRFDEISWVKIERLLLEAANHPTINRELESHKIKSLSRDKN